MDTSYFLNQIDEEGRGEATEPQRRSKTRPRSLTRSRSSGSWSQQTDARSAARIHRDTMESCCRETLRVAAQRCACLDGVGESQTNGSAEPDAEQRA